MYIYHHIIIIVSIYKRQFKEPLVLASVLLSNERMHVKSNSFGTRVGYKLL